MKRTLILLAAVVGFATAANAATLNLVSDKATYNVGETIVLTATGTTAGTSDAAVALFVRVEYDAALTEGVSGMQTPHTQMMTTPIAAGFAGPAGDGAAHLLDQVIGISPGTVNATPTVGTVTLIAQAAGVVNVSYFVQAGDALTLNYFGITSQPGISFLIVPEPTTAALIGLGLVGLVLGGRRRA